MYILSPVSITCVYMCPGLNIWNWTTSVVAYPWKKLIFPLLAALDCNSSSRLKSCGFSLIHVGMLCCYYANLVWAAILLRFFCSASLSYVEDISKQGSTLALTVLPSTLSQYSVRLRWNNWVADVSFGVWHFIITYPLNFGYLWISVVVSV